MNNILRLQNVIEYIEEHLTDKIDYNELAKIKNEMDKENEKKEKDEKKLKELTKEYNKIRKKIYE